MADGPARTSAPCVAVVVPTFERSDRLRQLIASLELQRGAPPFEVVIVDDGSSDGTAQELERLAASATVPVRTIRHAENRGAPAARNTGWRATAAPLVAFTDDDCQPRPGWLAALVGAASDADVVQGRTAAHPDQRAEGLFAWAPTVDELSGLYETCNIVYRRATLEALGGFRERLQPLGAGGRPGRFGAVWGDDTDMGLRAAAAGATIRFAHDAVVWHDVKPGGLRDRLRDIRRRTAIVEVVKLHPELRRRWGRRWFIDPAHMHVLAGVLGGAFVIARPRHLGAWALSAAAWVAWLRGRAGHYPKRMWPRVVPQLLIVDAADVAGFAAASLRARTVFL